MRSASGRCLELREEFRASSDTTCNKCEPECLIADNVVGQREEFVGERPRLGKPSELGMKECAPASKRIITPRGDCAPRAIAIPRSQSASALSSSPRARRMDARVMRISGS